MQIEKSIQIIFDEIKYNSIVLELGVGASTTLLEKSLKNTKNCIVDVVNFKKDTNISKLLNHEIYDYIIIYEAVELFEKNDCLSSKLISKLNKNGLIFITELNSSYIGFVNSLIYGDGYRNRTKNTSPRYSKHLIHQLLIENSIYPEKIHGISKRLDDSEFKYAKISNSGKLMQLYTNDEDAWVDNWVFQAKKNPSAVKIKSAPIYKNRLELRLFGLLKGDTGYTYICTASAHSNILCDVYFSIPITILNFINSLHIVAPVGCDNICIGKIIKIQEDSSNIELDKDFLRISKSAVFVMDEYKIKATSNLPFIGISTDAFDLDWSGNLFISMNIEKQEESKKSFLNSNYNMQNIECRKIDVIIPIFNAFIDVVDCIENVLQNTLNINYRIIAINDKSSDVRVENYLASLCKKLTDEKLLVINNSENIGFVKSVNKGMAIDNNSDVVLLNSDTIVTKNWLAEIINTSNQDHHIGIITPFSNNGEIVSFPIPNKNNAAESTPKIDLILDAMTELKDIPAPDLPTGVGFCYFIRRRLINQIGFLDEILFGKGYGEENDFSVRAKKMGWRNVLCLTAFVIHKGRKSFGNENEIKTLRRNNLLLLKNKHPEYANDVRNFIQTDSLRIYRDLLLSSIYKKSTHGRRVFHILHPLGGGTERHIGDIINNLTKNYRHVKGIVSGESILIYDYSYPYPSSPEKFSIFHKLKEESWEEFISGVATVLNISLIHVHHLMGNRKGVLDGVKKSGFKYLVTIHDGYLWCPNTSFVHSKEEQYCEVEQNEDICKKCENFDPFEWRRDALSFLRGAEFIISPSKWNTEWIEKSFSGITVQTIPHGIKTISHIKIQSNEKNSSIIKVAIIGGIGSAKGANLILKLVELTQIKKLPIQWIVIGTFSPKNKIQTYPEGLLTIHGRYHPNNLNKIINDYQLSLIFYPGPKPENYCYTLSETMPSGIPFLTNPHGAVAERVLESKSGWVFKNINNIDSILEQIIFITSNENKENYTLTANNTLKYQGAVEFKEMIRFLSNIYEDISTSCIKDLSMKTTFSNKRVLDSFREIRPIPSHEDFGLPEWVAPSIQKKRLIWMRK